MADKKSPASGWPIIQGDYHTGDANSPVAVITMGSHLDETAICAAGAALAGSCKTENLGIEKIVANENLTEEHIKRFQEQVEIVNIMESEDLGQISAKINELKGKDPGAFGADPIVVQISEDDGGSAGGAETGEEEPLTGEMALITARMKNIQMMVTDIGYRTRFSSGLYGGKIEGLMIGLIMSFIILGVCFYGWF